MNEVPLLEISDEALKQQVAMLKDIRKTRNTEAVQNILKKITKVAESDGNLLEVAIEAVRLRATIGEISDAMEKVFGRFKTKAKIISNVYSSAYANTDNKEFQLVKKRVDAFEKQNGRRPRIFCSKMGQDGHDRGLKIVASAFSDLGFDVDISPMFQTPEEAAKTAIENDVHVIGVSSLAAGHKVLIPKLIEELKKQGNPDIKVTVGGVIPNQDYDILYKAGALAIFGPGTNLLDAANKTLELLE